jgi:hypothetical protein
MIVVRRVAARDSGLAVDWKSELSLDYWMTS